MLGKANEIKTTGALRGIDAVDECLKDNPNWIVLKILISPTNDIDYFYIIYKEESA